MGAKKEGFVYIFTFSENRGVDAVKPASSHSPPDYDIYLSNPSATTTKNNTHPYGWVLFFGGEGGI